MKTETSLSLISKY